MKFLSTRSNMEKALFAFSFGLYDIVDNKESFSYLLSVSEEAAAQCCACNSSTRDILTDFGVTNEQLADLYTNHRSTTSVIFNKHLFDTLSSVERRMYDTLFLSTATKSVSFNNKLIVPHDDFDFLNLFERIKTLNKNVIIKDNLLDIAATDKIKNLLPYSLYFDNWQDIVANCNKDNKQGMFITKDRLEQMIQDSGIATVAKTLFDNVAVGDVVYKGSTSTDLVLLQDPNGGFKIDSNFPARYIDLLSYDYTINNAPSGVLSNFLLHKLKNKNDDSFDKLDDKLKIKALKNILGRTNNLATIILLASIIRSIGKERAIEELGEKKYSVFANSAVSNFSESYNLQYASCHSKPLIVDAIKDNQQIEMPSEVIVADQLEALINMDVISLDSTLDIVGTLCKKSRTFASFIETFHERYATIQYMIGVYRMSSE